MAYFSGLSPITLDKTNGWVGIGQAAPVAALHITSATFPIWRIERITSVTNVVRSTGQILHTTSSDMVDGFGVSMDMAIQDSAGVVNTIGSLFAFRNGADNSSNLRLQTYAAGVGVNALTLTSDGRAGFAGVTSPTAAVHAAASSAARASFCAPHGVAPDSPVNGDWWTTTAGAFIRINGVTYSIDLTAV